MNCNNCQNEMHHLFDEHAEVSLITSLIQHLADCKSCTEKYNVMKNVIDFIRPKTEITAPLLLKQNILEQISNETIMFTINHKRAKLFSIIKKTLSVAAIVAAIMLVIPFLHKSDSSGNTAKAAVSFFESAIKANDLVRNMEFKFSVRTDSNENFAFIGKECGMVEHTLLKSFEKPEKWLVQKSGRTVLFDGVNQYLWIPKEQQAIKGPAGSGFIEWFGILLDPSSILLKETNEVKEKGSKTTMSESKGKLYVNITSKAEGNFLNDYMKNKSIRESDNRREYIFDNTTKLLKGLKIYLMENKKETLILDIDNIDYDVSIDPSSFVITLPDGVEWKELSTDVKNETFSNISSKRAATLIFEDLSKKDFDTNKEVWEQQSKILESTYGGLQVIKIGEPFKSGLYPGEFVPYTIKLSNGAIKKWKLALRNDNKNKVWIVDGGL